MNNYCPPELRYALEISRVLSEKCTHGCRYSGDCPQCRVTRAERLRALDVAYGKKNRDVTSYR